MNEFVDMHVHSKFSIDGMSTMEDYCLIAGKTGTRVICFTEHVDFNSAEKNLSIVKDRNGVANLIMVHEDFKDKQIILSTHGEQFVLKLKDRLGSSRTSRDAIIYKFLPADTLQERGVVVEYSDAKTPIEAAKKKYEESELKDAASKCRQAMESVSYNLWNKISNYRFRGERAMCTEF